MIVSARAYIATMNVYHDGVRYVPGSAIPLDATQAARLLASGAIREQAQPAQEPAEGNSEAPKAARKRKG